MKRVLPILLMLMMTVPAFAKGHRHHRHNPFHGAHTQSGSRPHAWCGWYMRQTLGVADAAYNLARNWAHYGSAAGGPCVGCVVVWPHHVGIITAQKGSSWVVKSGNDSHAVRERARSVAGAIAFRRV